MEPAERAAATRDVMVRSLRATQGGDFDEARRLVEEQLAQVVADPEPRLAQVEAELRAHLAVILEMSGDVDASIHALREAAEQPRLAEREAMFRFALGGNLLAAGLAADAVRELRRSIDLFAPSFDEMLWTAFLQLLRAGAALGRDVHLDYSYLARRLILEHELPGLAEVPDDDLMIAACGAWFEAGRRFTAMWDAVTAAMKEGRREDAVAAVDEFQQREPVGRYARRAREQFARLYGQAPAGPPKS
jgi:tetratricopeptide (TPR) repeat protein